jgi:uncharacterized protein
MKVWLSFALFVILMLLLKVYISGGMYQATSSNLFKICYLTFSIVTLLLGTITLLLVFPKGIKDMNFIQNFMIALMVSVILCELILGAFFLFDDIVLLIQKYFINRSANDQIGIENYSRRRFIKTFGLVVSSFPFASFLYGITKGKYDFKVFENKLSFSDLPIEFDGFKIVQFSDLHSGGFDSFEDVKRGFDLIQAQNPDLILFTGDLVNDIAEEVKPFQNLLNELHSPYGKYSILGNHDYSEDDRLFPAKEDKLKNSNAIQQYQKEAGFTLLNNDNVKIVKSNSFIRLIGVENWGNGFIKKGDLNEAIKNCNENEFSILMSHDPTHWEKVVLKHPKKIHLTLSGHTHGMQMGIESFGIKWSPIKYFYKYWAGLYKELNQYLYVNRGFGFMAFAGRIGIVPEITVITLKSKK